MCGHDLHFILEKVAILVSTHPVVSLEIVVICLTSDSLVDEHQHHLSTRELLLASKSSG